MHMLLLFPFCLYILSLSFIPTQAQFGPGLWNTRGECIDHCYLEHYGSYSALLQLGHISPSRWCIYWSLECDCIVRDCSNFNILCDYDGGYQDDDCTVQVDQDVIPTGALVPGPVRSPTTGMPTPTTSGQSSTRPPGILAENPTASVVSATGSFILVVSAALGSLFAANRAASLGSNAFSSHWQGHSAVNAASVGAVGFQAGFIFQCASAVDPVSLLLHFQFLSFSGLLTLEYPIEYLGFTFNFGWANFLFPYPPIENAANGMMNKSCWKAGRDQRSPGGFEILAAHYGIPAQDLAGMVYICVSIGMAIILAFFALVGVILLVLERITRNSKKHETIKRFRGRWPAISSNTTLRVFIWILGTISTFAFFQFAHTCGGAPLAVAIVEFLLILVTLIVVSMLIRRIARSTGGLDALFIEDENSKYACRWGSLYITLKRETYWFFIPQYFWVILRSAIIAFAQGRGLIQMCLLAGLELAIFFILLFRRPFGTTGGNAVHIIESGYRLVSTGLLSTFLTEVELESNARHVLYIVIMSLGIAYAGALFLLFVIKAGAAFIEWRDQRRQNSDVNF